MKKLILFISIIVTSITLNAQEEYNNISFKSQVPEFVSYNSEFQISVISRIDYSEIKSLSVKLSINRNVKINSIYFQNNFGEEQLFIENYSFGENNNTDYFFDLNTEILDFQYNSPFQIIVNAKAGETEFSDLEMSYKITDDEKSDFITVIEKKIEFYKAGNNKELCLRISSDEEYIQSIQKSEYDKNSNILSIDFWYKTENPSGKIFSVINTNSFDTLFSADINKYQILDLSRFQNITNTKEIFVGKKSWLNFKLELSQNYSESKLIVNENEFPLNITFSNSEEYLITFTNIGKGNVYLDNFEISQSQSDKSFSDKSKTTGKLIFLEDFEKLSEEELVFSDVPHQIHLFELNITPFQNSFLLDWKLETNQDVKEFEIEKSNNGKSFDVVAEVEFDESKELYSYIDSRLNNDEIIFYRIKQINSNSSISYTNIVKVGKGIRNQFVVNSNYPNPFNPITSINIDILEASDLSITVYNIVGKKVKTVFSGNLAIGPHSFKFDATNLPSGIYLYEVKTDLSVVVKKMILAK